MTAGEMRRALAMVPEDTEVRIQVGSNATTAAVGKVLDRSMNALGWTVERRLGGEGGRRVALIVPD